MSRKLFAHLENELDQLKKQGLFKAERLITSPQSGEIRLADGQQVVNFCANNYLGLADHPALIEAAAEGCRQYGFGMASVRFICGTQSIHKALEQSLSRFLEMDDAILYTSCFDANGGLFETILSSEDAVISDELNHASVIDGIRLSKASRFRYRNNDMADLELQLKAASASRFRLIVTDGVFSMDGTIANLAAICDLADRYDALVMVDDSHAVGFMGEGGRGTPEECGVMGRVDILTGTFGKALGGALGGYTAARQPIVDWLRQRSRPYLFSNSLPPALVMASLKAVELLTESGELRQRLWANARYFREQMERLGFELVPGHHPIIPVMLGEAQLASDFAAQMLNHGIYVVGFSYPVVPQGRARIRTQISAVHTREDLDLAIEAFATVGRELGVIR